MFEFVHGVMHEKESLFDVKPHELSGKCTNYKHNALIMQQLSYCSHYESLIMFMCTTV